MKCFPLKMYAPTPGLLKGNYKFIPKIQPSLLGSKNNNFSEFSEDFKCF